MPKIVTIGFDKDLLSTALGEIAGTTVLVFPTRRYAGYAERTLFENWCFEDVRFISIDDLKTQMLMIERPELMEDKRLLCLFQAIPSELKEEFHLYGYEDIVSWGQHFFRLFEELAEEEISIQKLDELCGTGIINLQEWQERFLKSIFTIRESYQSLIQAKGFTDKIFSLNRDNLRFISKGLKYVFVNQYYYTAFEKTLIKELEQHGNNVTIICQTERDSGESDIPGLESPDLYKVFQGDEYHTKEIKVVQTRTEEQMMLEILSTVTKENLAESCYIPLIAARFTGKAYSRLFDREIFGLGHSYSFAESYCYTFLSIISRDISAINKTKNKRFIPIRNIISNVSDPQFVRYVCGEAHSSAELMRQLTDLTADDIIYLDMDIKLFDLLKTDKDFSALKTMLKSYFLILEKYLQVKDPQSLIEVFRDKVVRVEDLFSAEEHNYTNAMDQFVERAENFVATQRLGLVSDWTEIFGAEPYAIAAGLLDLFLASAKTAVIRREPSNPRAPLYEVTNLLDCRNFRYKELLFFDVIEGVIPSAPEPVWLFNEAQRKRIGLKGYDDVRDWERYYFYRMILGAERVTIYTYSNPEQDIEPGSFVSELAHLSEFGALGEVSFTTVINTPRLQDYYQARLGDVVTIPLSDSKRGINVKDQRDFFYMPFEAERDLGAKKAFHVSYYAADKLMKNPFAYYIEQLSGLKQASTEVEETVTRKFFGTLVHDYLATLLGSIRQEGICLSEIRDRFADKAEVHAVLNGILESDIYGYKLPQNYNWDFLRDVIADCIADTVHWFFIEFLPTILPESGFRLIPEEDTMTRSEFMYKQLLSGEETGNGYALAIRGKADLRIERPGKYSIVDFKTGRASDEQLIFYEWFYYLLKDPVPDVELEAVFAKVLEQDYELISFQEKDRQKLKEKLKESIIRVVAEGYGPGSKSTDRQYLKEISRSDLFVIRSGGQNEQF